jgi:hypothetical protein
LRIYIANWSKPEMPDVLRLITLGLGLKEVLASRLITSNKI